MGVLSHHSLVREIEYLSGERVETFRRENNDGIDVLFNGSGHVYLCDNRREILPDLAEFLFYRDLSNKGEVIWG